MMRTMSEAGNFVNHANSTIEVQAVKHQPEGNVSAVARTLDALRETRLAMED